MFRLSGVPERCQHSSLFASRHMWHVTAPKHWPQSITVLLKKPSFCLHWFLHLSPRLYVRVSTSSSQNYRCADFPLAPSCCGCNSLVHWLSKDAADVLCFQQMPWSFFLFLPSKMKSLWVLVWRAREGDCKELMEQESTPLAYSPVQRRFYAWGCSWTFVSPFELL